ncbi:hypothetical protein [Polyangium aurulentum]|uniref:hypothetical protein n=1 Tax=Polyangium aurulentum TaxID=2567896 RepID=UPI0010AEE98A|nr:hypothetical protein [Polyangium aurulentum]UQA63359.1 hypothetical protein E8A73_023985 [Polyangium aurulentum]
MMLRTPFAIASAMVLFGCAARSAAPSPAVELRPGPAASPPDASGGDGGEILLWGRTGDAPPRTYRLAPDGTGRVIAEEEGIVIATSRGEWRWETSGVSVATKPCDWGNGPEGEAGTGSMTRASLRLRAGGNEHQDVIVPTAPDGVAEIEHVVTVNGSVGPVLFLEEGTYEYACGAHGGSEAEFHAWDVERGKAIDLLAQVPDLGTLKVRAEKILDDGEEDPEEARREDSPPELVQLLPVYDAQGRLKLDGQFARFACYACGDGMWSSYTRSAVIPSGWIPERLAPFAAPPEGVTAFVSARRGFKLGGWSRR